MLNFWKKKPQLAAPDTARIEAATEAAADVVAPMSAHAEALPADAYEAATEAAPGKAGWRERLRNSGFARGLSSLFVRNPKLDDDLLDEIETCLLSADVGVSASTLLVDNLRQRMHKREFTDANELLRALRADLLALIEPVAQPLNVDSGPRPFVILTVGVNGVGKTTTIGKLAKRFVEERKQVLLAAGDTFRAAAVEQLKVWAGRSGADFMSRPTGSDAAGLAFDALERARAESYDVLLIDTAGRLQNKQGLMDELHKIIRVLKKIDPDAPHEVLLVLDATVGRNALAQENVFGNQIGVTGIVMTKLDGTARGGVLVPVAQASDSPIKLIGVGEGIDDLQDFDARAFARTLVGLEDA
jgi:fused signal recognition particle receptor